jgi:hypothetical protein
VDDFVYTFAMVCAMLLGEPAIFCEYRMNLNGVYGFFDAYFGACYSVYAVQKFCLIRHFTSKV